MENIEVIANGSKTLHWIDYSILIIYLIVIAALGIWFSRGTKSTSKYFLANQSIPTWAVAFSLMATMISSASFVGTPGTVYEKGLILLVGHCMLPIVLIFVAFFIVPFYRHVVGMSAYEYLRKRFGKGAEVFSHLVFLQIGYSIWD